MKREDAVKLVKQGFEQLEKALEAGRSEELTHYLTTMARFHNYSFRNTLLIWMQNKNATKVAGFNTWKKLGRTVKRGEKGIAIFAPMPFRKKDAENPEASNSSISESDESQMMGFKVVHVFDVSQTEGEPLPGIAKLGGTVGTNLARIEKVVLQSDIEFVVESIEGGASGYSVGGKIVIDEGLSATEKFAVIAHELAHERLHHGERREKTDKKIRETEAEAVAYIVCSAFDVDATKRCSDYIQLYDGNSETLRESLSFIQLTAEWMIESIHSVELSCDHAIRLRDESGQLNGTWAKDDSVSPAKYSCGVCQKFYGYAGSKNTFNAKAV